MLSPRYLEGISDEIADIYAQLEADILQDMARRIARLSKITEASKWQARLLAETGALKKDINKYIRKYDPAVQKEIKAIYNDALIKNARADNRIFNEALGHGVSDINAQVMLASIQKTHSDLSRLTITTAYTSEQQFVQQANAAYMQVVTGAFSYDDAMKNACDKLAADGVTSVQYRNGKPVRLNIESAVRMNILTGVNQTASAMTLNNCDELGCDLVETTAHIGARPSHEEWQGQIFSISGNNSKYRPFSVCQLGEPDGICGINCRHSYYPYFEGMERHYTQVDLDEMEKQTVTFNGEKMSRYDAEEKLRYMERNVRKYKRRAIVQEAGGVDNTAARVKIGEWQTKIKDFTQQTKLERDRAREFIGTVDGKQPQGLPSKITTIKASAGATGAKTTQTIYTPKNTVGNITSINEIHNFDNYAEYVKLKYNADITTEVTTLTLEPCKQTLKGIESTLKDFPDLKLKLIKTDASGVASFGFDKLTLNPNFYKKSAHTIAVNCGYQSKVGFWPKNASAASIGAHESAHAVEWLLIQLNKTYTDAAARFLAWGDSTTGSLEAKKIVKKAIENIKATTYGNGKKKRYLILTISRYALETESETVAEAFADVYANGNKAAPLSLEIKRLTIELYNNYLKGVFNW